MLFTHSFPALAGFWTTTLPNLSVLAFSPSRPAVSITYFEIAVSFLEQRGIRAISAKYFHTITGCSPSIACDMVLCSFRYVVPEPETTGRRGETHMIAVGGAGSSALPAFESGT